MTRRLRADTKMIRSVDIHIDGIVQGVGFRPFVYRIARRNLVSGWVRNSVSGVDMHIEGESPLVDSFISDLKTDAPAAARVDSISVIDVAPQGCCGFEIKRSEENGADTASGEAGDVQDDEVVQATQIPADMATCPKCLEELFDHTNRRYGYPFINCTECGPRFTIITGLPYDRPKTSMAAFEMCPDCAREYSDPLDRRFHAQPDACFECGPRLSIHAPVDGTDLISKGFSGDRRGTTDDARGESETMILTCLAMIKRGAIVAEKGLGGYHLVCDATNQAAVKALRERKHRDGKPFAVMVRDVDEAKRICRVNEAEARLLSSPAAPIVLMRKRPNPSIKLADDIAPGLAEVGIMLPCTPLQHMLVRNAGVPLVMTSGNISESPIIGDNDSAHHLLDGVADIFLDNDREIVSRYDDSVARIIGGNVQMVRRARGYAPVPVAFPSAGGGGAGGRADEGATGVGTILGVGPEQKSTFCIARGGEAFVSQHIGDLESAEALESWQATLELYERVFSLSPSAVACDMHPEYLSTKWARSAVDAGGALAGAPLFEVQHHHAHIAAVLGEHIAAGNIEADEPVIGVALDGTGYGTDGTIWGGEVLVCNTAESERMGHLMQMPLPGGSSAVEHPVRMAYALLSHLKLLNHPGAVRIIESLGDDGVEMLDFMLTSGLGVNQTSSCGRLLDAFSALVGLCMDAQFDGQAPMLLESATRDRQTGLVLSDYGLADSMPRYAMLVMCDDEKDSCLVIDPSQTVRAILDDVAAGVSPGLISLRAHIALCDGFSSAVSGIRNITGITTVALSGGVMANRLVMGYLVSMLRRGGMRVLTHIDLPPNDGCISYGQAVSASARMSAGISI